MPLAIAQAAELQLSKETWISLKEFERLFTGKIHFALGEIAALRLKETRAFIEYLLSKQIQVYGLTTGFADLRDVAVSPDQAALLSKNLIRSHDAGIGSPPIPLHITLGAMGLRAHSLAKGYSGFSIASLETLIQMINRQVVPEIPPTGSLGASGDLAFLARLGRAMMGEAVPVWFQGRRMCADEALSLADIVPFEPGAKEGLALTNGTPFMASMMGSAFLMELEFLDNLFAVLGLFLNATAAIDAAYYEMMQTVRGQKGQELVARLLKPFLPPADPNEVQNDYSIRCLPQILGPKVELICEQREKIEQELNAVTDNPLIFRREEISSDVDRSRILSFEGDDWAVISGGNFHGETTATIADAIAIANAKIALTLERQLTYLLNPFRNHRLFPIYLVADSKRAGLHSGYMIAQYTGNALAHKISLLAHPTTTMNMTSANEAEDVVSYGATAAQRLLSQMDLLNELLAIHLLTTAQAYSLTRKRSKKKNPQAEKVFEAIASHLSFPQREDEGFDQKYATVLSILKSGVLGEILQHPFKRN